MTTRDLRQLLEHVNDTRELVLRPLDGQADRRILDELQAVWSAARADANLAYDRWRRDPGAEAYVSYRAAEDRADAAEDALSAASGHRTNVTRQLAGLNETPRKAD